MNFELEGKSYSVYTDWSKRNEYLQVTEVQQRRIQICQMRMWKFNYVNNLLTPLDLWYDFRNWFQFPWQYPIKKAATYLNPACFHCKYPQPGVPTPYCGNCEASWTDLVATQQTKHLRNFEDALDIMCSQTQVITQEQSIIKSFEDSSLGMI